MNLLQPTVHVVVQTDWWATILSGVIGSGVGVLGAFGAALYVVKRQHKDSVRLSALERKQSTALNLLNRITELRSHVTMARSSGLVEMLDVQKATLLQWHGLLSLSSSISTEVMLSFRLDPAVFGTPSVDLPETISADGVNALPNEDKEQIVLNNEYLREVLDFARSVLEDYFDQATG